MTAPLIGLAGYAGSGKDEAARALTAEGWTRVSFADPLREFAYAVDPLVRRRWWQRSIPLTVLVDRLGWEAAKRKYPAVRELLQRIGTDAGRTVLGQNVWVDAALRRLPDGPAVFTDVRFENEADAIRARGGVVARLERPGVQPVNGHASERAMDGYDGYDAVILNDGTVADLHRKVRSMTRVVFEASARQ